MTGVDDPSLDKGHARDFAEKHLFMIYVMLHPFFVKKVQKHWVTIQTAIFSRFLHRI
jgi:hypothetical protein